MSHKLVQFAFDFKIPDNEAIQMSEQRKKMFQFTEQEKKMIKCHKQQSIREKIQQKYTTNPYKMFDGPPFLSGKGHMGHAFIALEKSTVSLFQTMHGKNVISKLGWDTHGLPVEMMITKDIGLHTNQEIRDYGIANFNQKCEDKLNSTVTTWYPMFDSLRVIL